MAQISRLKDAEISNGNIINADDLDAEFDQLVSESNDQDDRISDIETGNVTLSGVKTFSTAPKTNQIDEQTPGSGVTLDGVLLKDAGITLADAGELTIASGAITVTGSFHTIDTESDAASDDLDTINGGADGRILRVQAENGARDVVIKHNTGNIYNPDGIDITLDDQYKIVTLKYAGALSKWVVSAAPILASVGYVGKVRQIQYAVKSDTFSSTSTSFVDITGLSVSITPTSASSKILLFAMVTGSTTNATYGIDFKFDRGGTSIGLGDAASNRTRVTSGMPRFDDTTAGQLHNALLLHVDAPSTTSATTYKVQGRTNVASTNWYINRTTVDTDTSVFARGQSILVAMEVGA